MEVPNCTSADKGQSDRLHHFAHDLKNRLSALWEVVRMLDHASTSAEERREFIAHAERAFLQAQRDVESMLDDFSVDRGIIVENPQPFDLRAAVEQAVAIEGHRYGKKQQELMVVLPEKLLAHGDRMWTIRILQALLSNASKFSPIGSVVRIEHRTMMGKAQLSVADEGVGLDERDLSQVFTRYALLTSRSTAGEPQARGTLARARQWAEAQGGFLTVSSRGAGHGSVFTLALPQG